MKMQNPALQRTLVVLGLATLVLAGAGLAWAQGPGCGHGCGGPDGDGPGQGWRHEHLMQALDLSEEQQAAITKIHDEASAGRAEHRKQMLRLRNELHGEMLKDAPDKGKVMDLAAQMGKLRTEQQQKRLATRLAVREVLTPEQRDKMLLMGDGCGHGRHDRHGRRGAGRAWGRGHGCGDCRQDCDGPGRRDGRGPHRGPTPVPEND